MFNSSIINNIYEKYRENKLAHAYLIETNNIDKAVEEIKELIKAINCESEFNKQCNNCNLCNLITKNNLPSLKIIEPEGTSIKKSQILELKDAFNSIPIYSKYNTYIIKSAEKLNSSSANAMLKFIEEPTPGILGFFLTNNKDIIIATVKSRCQNYVLNYQSDNILEKLNIDIEEFKVLKELVIKYLEAIDQSEYINNKTMIIKYLPERSQIIMFLKLIFEIYYQKYLKINNLEYDEKTLEIYSIPHNNDIINKKLKVIAKIIQEMSYNVSIELELDKFVLEMRGINYE